MTDPWGWLQHDPAPQGIDVDAHPVTAVVLAAVEPAVRAHLEAQSVPPAQIVVCTSLREGAERATGDWLWLFPQAVQPAPDALERLLHTAVDSTRIGLLGPLMVQSERRARVSRIESCGLTVTPAGRLVPAVEGGEPDQGQLSTMAVLGVDASAALVRRDVWADAGGLVEDLPLALAGLELGRRVNAAGRRVVAEPAARVVRPAAEEVDPAEQRSWELRLASAGASPWTRIRLLVGSLLGALGFLLGKDAARAAAELRALHRWLGDRAAESVLARRAVGRGVGAGLTPTRRELAGQALDRTAGRISDGWATLADRRSDTSLDELTGDDFAARGRLRRLAPVDYAAAALSVLTLVAARHLVGEGRLAGAGLLPSPPRWTDLLTTWLAPVAGQPGQAGPPWLGPTALAALASFGQVEWLVTGLFLLVVPLSWLLALRALRALGVEGPAAVLAAVGYALAPVLSGALGGGVAGVLAWTVLLPLLAHAVAGWAATGTWRAAGLTGLWLAPAVSVLPLAAVLVLVAMALVPAVRSRRGLGQWALVAAAGILGLGPALVGWTAFPGRFLTSSSPALAPTAAPDPWLLALAHPAGPGVPPLWVGAVVAGVAWLVALLGLFRRPADAAPGVAAAAVGLVAAIGLSRLVVIVPPGVEARPLAAPWLVLMLGGLALAGARGLTGLAAELRDRTLGAWHAAVLALTGVVVAAVALGAGWWAWDGTAALRRTTSADLPPFVRASMTSATPTRTLAIARTAGEIRWALLQDDLPRLGSDERGLPGSTEPQRGLATSVVTRLLSGSADDQLTADLARLGVGHVWVQGGDPELRTAIGNVPGLGVGTGDDDGATWPVPGAARMVIDGGNPTVTGAGAVVPAGAETRRLVLAEPADARWRADVDGAVLAPITMPDGRQAFELGARSGVLHVQLSGGAPWWPPVQLAGFAVLAVLAAPRLRRRS